jgi:hypothetical protein
MSAMPTVSFTDFLAKADTGDVVLWRGTSLISLAVELATFSEFSHSSMVIRDPKGGTPYLFQSVSEALATDPLSRQQVTKHDGVQAGPLEDVMKIVYGFKDFPTWVQLDWPDRPTDWNQTVWDLAAGMDGTRFPWVPDSDYKSIALMTGLLLLGRELDTEVLEPIFCSGLVAYMLQRAGAIGTNMKANGYEPKDFSSEYPGVVQPSAGVAFKPDVVIEMPTAGAG